MDFPNWICIGDDRRVCAARNGVSAEEIMRKTETRQFKLPRP